MEEDNSLPCFLCGAVFPGLTRLSAIKFHNNCKMHQIYICCMGFAIQKLFNYAKIEDENKGFFERSSESGMKRSLKGTVGQVRFRWILSCMGLSLLPVIIGIIIYLFSRSAYYRQTLNNNEVLLTQVQSLVDENLYNIRVVAENISASTSLETFSQQITWTASQRAYAKKKLRESLADYARQNSYINSIYLYFWDTGEVVTDKTSASADIIYLTYHQNQEKTFEEWLSVLQQKYTGNSGVMALTTGGRTLVYLKTLPSSQKVNVRATVAILVNPKIISQMGQSIGERSGCQWDILASSGEFVLSQPQPLELIPEEWEGWKKSPEIYRFKLEKENVLSLLDSETMDVVYWMQTPPAVYKETMHMITGLFIGVLTVILLGSAVFTFLFVSQNYTPIQKLLQLVPQWGTGGISGQKDEYTAIMEAFTSYQIEGTRLEEQLSQQDAMLLDTSLALLMKSSPSTRSEREGLERLRSVFPLPYITVLLLHPGETSPEGGGLPDEAYSPEGTLFLFLQRVGEGLCQGEVPGRFRILQQDKNIVLTLNTSQELQDSQREYIQEAIQGLNVWAMEGENPPPLVTVSKSREGLESLSACYEEAEYAVKYQMLFGIGVQEGEGAPLNATEHIDYSANKESQLLNAIFSGSEEQAVEILQSVWEANQRVSQSFQHCLLYQLIGTVLRAGNLLPSREGLDEHLRQAIRAMNRMEGMEKSYAAVEKLIRDITQLYNKEHDLATHRLKNDVLKYIDEHYGDVNLSVESLCGIFGKSRTYLFSLFKEDTGFSLMYHITRVRIGNAKRLLRDTSETIQEIAQKVGFNSAMSFTRAFKKYENIAPSKYREINQKR